MSTPTKPVLSTPRASRATPVCPVRDTTVVSSGNCFSRVSTSPAVCIDRFERDAGDQLDVHVERAFVHDRDELGPEPRHERGRGDQREQRRPEDDGAPPQRQAEERHIEALGRREDRAFPVPVLRAAKHSTGMTKIDSTSDDRSAIATVKASGENIFPSIPCSVMMGRKVSAMISSPKMLGLRTSSDRPQHRRQLPDAVLRQRQVALHVLDLDDGRVDDHPDRDRQPAQRHEVGVQPRVPHHDEGQQHRERQREDHHQRPADARSRKSAG